MGRLEKFQDPMTADELSRHWRVSADTVRAICEEGKLPGAYRVRKQWRIPKRAIECYESKAGEEIAS